MARLSEQEAVGLAWDFIRREAGWWWRWRRLERRPYCIRLVSREEWLRVEMDRPTHWLVSFLRKMDMDPATVGIAVDDASGACTWMPSL